MADASRPDLVVWKLLLFGERAQGFLCLERRTCSKISSKRGAGLASTIREC